MMFCERNSHTLLPRFIRYCLGVSEIVLKNFRRASANWVFHCWNTGVALLECKAKANNLVVGRETKHSGEVNP